MSTKITLKHVWTLVIGLQTPLFRLYCVAEPGFVALLRSQTCALSKQKIGCFRHKDQNPKMLLATTLLFFSFFAAAQSYDTAAGMRFGTDWGITFKQRIAKKTTMEAILQSQFSNNDVFLNLLVEQHVPIASRRINLYTGAGLHGGWLDTPEGSDLKNPFGISGIVGAEFTPGRLNISYDFKPILNLVGGRKTFQLQTGFSLRYVIVKRKWQPIKKLRDDIRKKRNKRKKKKEKKNWKFWEKD